MLTLVPKQAPEFVNAAPYCDDTKTKDDDDDDDHDIFLNFVGYLQNFIIQKIHIEASTSNSTSSIKPLYLSN